MPTPVPVSPVVWTDAINVVVSGNNLTKTAVRGAWDSGAASMGLLASGDGFVEFVAGETNQARMCGLAIGGLPDTNTDFADIDFAVYLQDDGFISVWEAGVHAFLPTPVPYATTDRIRVAVVGGVVQYSKNGAVFYTSGIPVAYPIRVDASLYSQNATVRDARTSF
jgi:hypothetical protein